MGQAKIRGVFVAHNAYSIFFLAFKDLLKHRKLMFFLSAALVLAITNSVLSSGMMAGFGKVIVQTIVETSTGHVSISPTETHLWLNNPNKLMDKATSFTQVKAAAERLRYSGRIESDQVPNSVSTATLIGMDYEAEPDVSSFSRKIVEGTFLTGAKGEAIIPKQLKLFTDLGLDDKIDVDVGGGRMMKLLVTGVADVGSVGGGFATILVNIDDLRDTLGLTNGETNSIVIKLYNENDADAVKAALLQEGLQENVVSWKQVLSAVQSVLDTWEALFNIITSVAILAASAGIAVMMYINILNKTRQIGTLKAVGASGTFVMLVFIAEALIIALVGIVVGNSLAFLGTLYFEQHPIQFGPGEISFVFNKDIMINTSLTALVFIFIASLYPAWRASKLEVVEALRYE